MTGLRFRWRSRRQAEHASAVSPVVPTSPSVPTEPPEVAFAELLLDEGREELARADGKASILLASSGIFVGAVLAASLDGKWSPAHLAKHPATEVAAWVSLSLVLVAVVLLAWAVVPRTKHSGERKDLAYFGHVVMFRSGRAVRKRTRRERDRRGKAELADAIRSASSDSFNRTVDQVWTISHIVDRKYKRVRWAIITMGLALGGFVGSLVAYWLLQR